MSKENQLKYMDYAVHINRCPKGTREARLNAANEYMARLSANVDLTQEERSIWNNIVEYVKKFLTQLGVQFKVTDEMIEDLLRASFRNFQRMNTVPDAFQQAEQILEEGEELNAAYSSVLKKVSPMVLIIRIITNQRQQKQNVTRLLNSYCKENMISSGQIYLESAIAYSSLTTWTTRSC